MKSHEITGSKVANATQTEGALSECKVLDLTEGGFNLCGRVLADLGADVIRVETPGGSATRRMPPLLENVPASESSLVWLAYNMQKRGITLNLNVRDGMELFKRLVKRSNIVLESYSSNYLQSIGLGYEALKEDNPRVIMTHMTHFEHCQSYDGYKGTDLTNWASGGMSFVTGDEDRPPLRVSFPLSEAVAGAQAAAGTLHAWWYMVNSGEGQEVNTSCQAAMAYLLYLAIAYPTVEGTVPRREGIHRGYGFVRWKQVFPCKDGYVSFYIWAGIEAAASMRAFTKWLDEEGLSSDELNNRVWEEWGPSDLVRKGKTEALNEIRDIEERATKLFARKTKQECFERAVRDKIRLAPCATAKDIAANPQLASREFWTTVDHPWLPAPLTCPGRFARMSECATNVKRAPLIGEHNWEVFGGELGLSRAELELLSGIGAI